MLSFAEQIGSTMFKITARASGINAEIGVETAKEIEIEFRGHRSWHERASCSFVDGDLILIAFNDYDENGLALLDELSDCLAAFIPPSPASDDCVIELVAIEKI
jgi:hypothetical protein